MRNVIGSAFGDGCKVALAKPHFLICIIYYSVSYDQILCFFLCYYYFFFTFLANAHARPQFSFVIPVLADIFLFKDSSSSGGEGGRIPREALRSSQEVVHRAARRPLSERQRAPSSPGHGEGIT